MYRIISFEIEKVGFARGSPLASRNSPHDRGPFPRGRHRRSGTPGAKSSRRKPFGVAPRVKRRVVAPYVDASRLRFVYLQRRHGDGRALSLSPRVVLRRAPLAPSVQSAQNDTRILVLRLARRSAASYDDPLLEFYGPTDGVRHDHRRRVAARRRDRNRSRSGKRISEAETGDSTRNS